MKRVFYPKLAVDGIRKNKKLYIPYIITCVLSVAMFYIMRYICLSKVITKIPKTDTIREIMSLGSGVIAIFSVIFLFYTNSFLIKTRKKEFGLYNVLGMDKHGIGRILIIESLLVALLSLFFGILFGIAFSKLCELILLKIVSEKITFSFYISASAVLQTAGLFLVIFFAILLNSIRQIRFANPLDLVRSGNIGEKPPKANYLFGIFGFLLLGVAYYLSVSIDNPVDALLWFFVAVIMVIVGSYLVFISGSVMLCRLLQKNKKYYYKKNHFVSVSSMAYRMKRNGAGLASICILLTMVLVMISSTSCLFIGSEDTLKNRCPKDIMMNVRYKEAKGMTDKNISVYKKEIKKTCEKYNVKPENIWEYRDSVISGMINKYGSIEIDPRTSTSRDYSNLISVHIIPIEDYYKFTGKKYRLKKNEAVAFATLDYKIPRKITLLNSDIKIIKTVKPLNISGLEVAGGITNIFVFASDAQEIVTNISLNLDNDSDYTFENSLEYGFDVKADEKTQQKITDDIAVTFGKIVGEDENAFGYTNYCISRERNDFLGTFGGFFFLGIMLSCLFLVVAVIIIYYKQISEGFEDANRFDIMQKVGMTKKDIKKSINSQMLLVFFLPIGFAVLHLGFAFPLIKKLLLLFGLNNLGLLVLTTAISTLASAMFYFIVYRLTSNVYYGIVSGKK